MGLLSSLSLPDVEARDVAAVKQRKRFSDFLTLGRHIEGLVKKRNLGLWHQKATMERDT